MQDLQNMTFKDLQAVAKEKGVNTFGLNKDKLIVAIQNVAANELAPESLQEPKVSKPAKIITTPVSKPEIITDFNDIYDSAPKPLKVTMDAQKIIDHCNDIFSKSLYPSARARASTSGEGIDFVGGPKQLQFVTIHQPAKTIFHYAKLFVAKAIVEKTRTDDNGEITFISEIA